MPIVKVQPEIETPWQISDPSNVPVQTIRGKLMYVQCSGTNPHFTATKSKKGSK